MKGGLRLFGHPMHVMLVHFPIALWPASLLCDVVRMLHGGDLWRQTAYWCLAAGSIASVPAIITGIIDYLGIQGRERAERVALQHLMAMTCALALFIISLCLRGSPTEAPTSKPIAPVLLSAAGMLPLLFGAWLGGELVLRHGIGQIKQHGEE